MFRNQKKHFLISEVNFLDSVPKDNVMTVMDMYLLFKNDAKVKPYLPHYGKKRPDRMFLFNILNTVYPGSIWKKLR